jgi:hypothetical protein
MSNDVSCSECGATYEPGSGHDCALEQARNLDGLVTELEGRIDYLESVIEILVAKSGMTMEEVEQQIEAAIET